MLQKAKVLQTITYEKFKPGKEHALRFSFGQNISQKSSYILTQDLSTHIKNYVMQNYTSKDLDIIPESDSYMRMIVL